MLTLQKELDKKTKKEQIKVANEELDNISKCKVRARMKGLKIFIDE